MLLLMESHPIYFFITDRKAMPLFTGVLCDEKKVYDDVIDAHHYNTKVRPRHNSSEAVLVELEFELTQITTLVCILLVYYVHTIHL